VFSKILIGFLIFILFIHFLATANFWYWKIWWFDIPMHFFGGFWAAMLFFWLNSKFEILNSKITRLPDYLTVILITLSFVAFIGVFWEFFEYFYIAYVSKGGLTGSLAFQNKAIDFYTDTVKDLFFDLFGGSIFLIISKFPRNKDFHSE